MEMVAAAAAPRATIAPGKGLLAALRRPAAASSDSSAESDNGSDSSGRDSDASMPRPQAALNTTTSLVPQISPRANPTVTEEDNESDDGAAYERMKKRLAAVRASEVAQPASTKTISSDDDDVPVRANTRRHAVRKSTSARPSVSPTRSAQSRQSTPGLFVTPNVSPEKSRTTTNPASDSDSSRPRRATAFQDRVRRIREERLAKEKEEQTQQEQQRSANKAIRRRLQQDADSESDGENGRRLTQQAKPTRKAGKKAMEAMARDQQRIARNMQLTHQAKTKKKHTVKDLFSRFGFDSPAEESAITEALPTRDPGSTTASSDAEANQASDTPPTSPPPAVGSIEKQQPVQLEETPAPTKLDKGKGRAPEFQHLPPHPWEKQSEDTIVGHATVAPNTADEVMIDLSDSDDEAAQPKSTFPVFDRMPLKNQENSSSLLHLRHLAHLTSPKDTRKGSKSMSLSEMQSSLAQKAREQAQKEREEKIAELKRRGIHIETEEEREKNQADIEDMVAQLEKQRQEDLKLAKLEKEEARKNGEAIDDLPSSDESDGDYIGSGEEDANEADAEDDVVEEVELELSGSEDEDIDNAEDVVAEDAGSPNALVNGNGDGRGSRVVEEQQAGQDVDMEDAEPSAFIRQPKVKRNRHIVVDDEDEDDGPDVTNASPTQVATQDNAIAAFGFGNAPAGIGLTQMFAGTIANLESGSQTNDIDQHDSEQNSLDFLRSLPDTQPGANFSQTSDFIVPNSQTFKSPQKTSQTGAETQFSLGISQLLKTSPAFSRTQLDLEDFEPTQDAGFSFSRSPVGLKAPPSTIDTVLMSVVESPVKQRKGKLQRGRKDAVVELSDVEDDLADDEAHSSDEDDIQRPPKPRDAFAKLAKGAKKQKAVDDFDQKTSLAKGAVMDQAEESEDEYAGIGGASDDDSGEEDEETKKMIEHGEVDVDERQLAALYADKTKKEDERNFNELYKNVMNGGLRRRAGGRGVFDMDDSEDEEESRQRKKRDEFQKMSRALLADERIGDIAKDQKKQAFFHTLADFADEGEYDFLDMPADLGVDGETSQSQEHQECNTGDGQDFTIPDSQTADTVNMPAPANSLKRKSPSNSQKENRPPPNLRRTATADNFSRKPLTLADVQHSVSELLEDPRVMVPDSQYSESESDDESPAPNAASRKPIIDRLTLSRTSSMSEAAADGGNLAFHAPSRTANAPGFRIPSLIRQATSNLSNTSDSRRSSGASTPTESVRRGGTGKSNIHAQAREAERRQLLEKKDSRRKEALKKKVSAGRKAGMRSVLGDLGGGFE